ncbi:unnamed protein product [Symbiodinium sp. CCMP2592]|nr:unnamed protein product [Symbiodinium sp. CCMP2592]
MAEVSNSLKVRFAQVSRHSDPVSVHQAFEELAPFGEITRLELLPEEPDSVVVSYYDSQSALRAALHLGDARCYMEQLQREQCYVHLPKEASGCCVEEISNLYAQCCDGRTAANVAQQFGVREQKSKIRKAYVAPAAKPDKVVWANLDNGKETRTTLRITGVPVKCKESRFHLFLENADLAEHVDIFRLFAGSRRHFGTALVNAVSPLGVKLLAKFFHGRQWGAAGRIIPAAARLTRLDCEPSRNSVTLPSASAHAGLDRSALQQRRDETRLENVLKDQAEQGLSSEAKGASDASSKKCGGELAHTLAGDMPGVSEVSTEEVADDRPVERRYAEDATRRLGEARDAETAAIEMQSMEAGHSRELLPVVSAASSSAARPGDDRTCFICLQDSEKDNPLVSCCSTCYARTHRRCWREWRNNQHRTALRSHLLGLRIQTNHMLRCTICKSGTAMVEGEENGLSWMNELMCGGEPSENSLLGRLIALGNRREDSDEDPEAQLEDLIDTRTCIALVIYLGVLIVAIVVACLLIVTRGFWAGDVVLCCIIALYELSVLQLVLLAILRRRDTTLQSAGTRQAAEEPSAAREIQLQTLSEPS